MSKEIFETENEMFDIRLIVNKNNNGTFDYIFMNGKNDNGFSYGSNILNEKLLRRKIVEIIEDLLEVE